MEKQSSSSSGCEEISQKHHFGDGIREKTENILHKITDNIFASAGIKFIRIEQEHTELIIQFLNTNFLPYDLITKSHGVTEDKVFNSTVEICIREGICVMATNKHGDVIGVHLASIYRRGDWIKKVESSVSVGAMFDWSAAAKAREVNTKLLKLLGYTVWGLFDGQDCQVVAGDILICTSKESPFIGLGTELVRHGEIAAREHECDLALCVTTDSHTQSILRDCGYTLRSVVVLYDFRDENGGLYLKDVDEDATARVLCKNIRL